MGHILPDGRTIMAAYQDIVDFLEHNRIIGRIITDIRAKELDYIIRNMKDIDDICLGIACCGIETDGQVCLLFADGDHMEIDVPGDGPIILGMNTACFDQYAVHDGTCYSVKTLFQHCIGHKIMDIDVRRSKSPMEFPRYCGIDMSAEDEGVKEISFILDDSSRLNARGSIDYFQFSHDASKHEMKYVPFSELLSELNMETLTDIFGEHNAIRIKKSCERNR